jgi:hypothetical protein
MMDGCFALSGCALALKQKPDEQAESSDCCAASCSEQPSDGESVGAACRIVAITQQLDMIGQRTHGALAGVNDGKTNGCGIDRKAGKDARNAPVGRDYECRGRMRELVAIAVICGRKSQGPGQFCDGRGIAQ